MDDFTLSFYASLLDAINRTFPSQIFQFDDFLRLEKKPGKFCILRHDVDRNLNAALEMAKIENSKNIKATYYFRKLKDNTHETLVKLIRKLGHDIGYHYESLADCKGIQTKALDDFKKNLGDLRRIVEISTISMHGSPLSFYNNIDLWKNIKRKQFFKELDLAGEVYLDIDYTDIAYITDTGRRWNSESDNLRDKVESSNIVNLKNGFDLIGLLDNNQVEKIVLQIHPERWTDNKLQWFLILIKDCLTNQIKKVLRVMYGVSSRNYR